MVTAIEEYLRPMLKGMPVDDIEGIWQTMMGSSYWLESLPKKMADISASISRLENNLADPAFYEKNPASFAKTVAALDKERQNLAALEEEWLELEMLREELEG